jgi:transketolase
MGKSSSINREGIAISDPAQLARLARVEIIKMTHKAGASHVGSALSVVDILSVLYTTGANISANNVNQIDRDVILLSKGHAAAALYSILGIQGFFPSEWLSQYCMDGAPLGGHVTSKGVPGVELSTGSLGHAFPYGVGIALSRKRKNLQGKVFIVMSDGECDEGTTWESALIANHFDLTNLVVIIDRNRIQSLTFTEETIMLEPFIDKWRAFGWEAIEVDGHNYLEIEKGLTGRGPLCVIANTVKGRGVDFMENSVLWHYKSPNEDEALEAIDQVNLGKK